MARVRAGRRRGYSVLELVVSMAVLAPVLFIAAALLRESQLVFVRYGRAALDPVPQLALATLRHDVFAARRFDGGSLVWSDAPLALDRGSGRRVLYRWRAGELEREELDSSGAVLSSRVILTRVRGWRWRVVSPRLLDFEIVHEQSAGIAAAVLPGRPIEADPSVVGSRLRLALRGGRGGQRW